MRLISRRTLRRAAGPLAVAAVLLAAGMAQEGPTRAATSAPSATVPAPTQVVAKKQQIDPALRDLAAQKAGDLVLTSADGERKCPLTLKAEPSGAGFLLEFDRTTCAEAIAFIAEVSAWLPDVSGAVHLLNPQGRTVAEFTEATGGSYEALREGDGVYFLSNPTMPDGTEVTAAEVTGDWVLSTSVDKPLCRWTLADEPAPKDPKAKGAPGGQAVKVGPGCDAAMARLNPVSWRLEGGNILVSTRSGPTIRFARQEDGGWARVPERGRPLLMSRP